MGVILFEALSADAQTPDETPALQLGQEYSSHSEASPRSASSRPTWKKILLYLPNRIFDAIDIVRIDAGVGPSTGAVVRITSWGQAGYRSMSPVSMRVGLHGRELPIFLERSSEFGIGPAFVPSLDREVTPLEVGVGTDLFLVGAYVGVSVDEFFDFLGGWVGIDFKGDDL